MRSPTLKRKYGYVKSALTSPNTVFVPFAATKTEIPGYYASSKNPKTSSIERTRTYNGRYHVLGGAINPIGGIGPEQLRVRELLTRLQDEAITEVILATNPNLEGEATATYLTRMLSTVGITLSRLASGLPVGGDLEYADEVTLGRAFEGRRKLGEAS